MVNLLYIDDDAGLARLLAKALGVHGIQFPMPRTATMLC